MPLDGPCRDGKYHVAGCTTSTDDPEQFAVYCYLCQISIPDTTATVFFDGRRFIVPQMRKLLAGRGRSGEDF